MKPKMAQKKAGGKEKDAASLLLAWYARHARVLPWRAAIGEKADPYRVWLSEMMLQQTTVATVGPYFERFLARWPDLASLAAASADDVLRLWAGLGYYRRARALHTCALEVQEKYGGRFPEEEKALLALPGIGPYTAAAIRAIAFDKKANVVDGNVERVIARLFAVQTPLPKAKAELRALAEKNLPTSSFSSYAQAMMDLGATVCTPRNPKCDLCPLLSLCAAKKAGFEGALPRSMPKKPKPKRHAVVFLAQKTGGGAVFMRQRPEKGLLAGMMEFPSTPWTEGKRISRAAALAQAPFQADWVFLRQAVHHSFTHFDLELTVACATIGAGRKKGIWVAPRDLLGQALPSLMRKVWRVVEKVGKKEGDR